MDLVSIIIPVYGVEEYLDHCIQTVVSQTYSNLEIILVDDGSPDRCPEICDLWGKKDSRIHVVHQKNGGLSAARNTGLSMAKGTYILLLDSDDYISPDTVWHMVDAIHKTKADMVICDYIKGSERNYLFKEYSNETLETIDREEALKRIYSSDSDAFRYSAAWCKLYKAEQFEGIHYPKGKIFEDIYTTHKLLYRCDKIAVLDEKLFYYYQRPESIMNTKFHIRKLDYLQALVERVQFFRERHLTELESIAYDELLHSLIWEYSRTRDILHSKEGMEYTIRLFRENYRKDYASKRYPKENRMYLKTFYRNPEHLILYWRISGKVKALFGRKG